MVADYQLAFLFEMIAGMIICLLGGSICLLIAIYQLDKRLKAVEARKR